MTLALGHEPRSRDLRLVMKHARNVFCKTINKKKGLIYPNYTVVLPALLTAQLQWFITVDSQFGLLIWHVIWYVIDM